jgi:hypothetical protein
VLYAGKGQPRRYRSVSHILGEIEQASERHPGIQQIQFWDEVFAVRAPQGWLDEFCERVPREIGLPFGIWSHPGLLTEPTIEKLERAGLKKVVVQTRMGPQTAFVGGAGPVLVLLHGAGDQAGQAFRVAQRDALRDESADDQIEKRDEDHHSAESHVIGPRRQQREAHEPPRRLVGHGRAAGGRCGGSAARAGASGTEQAGSESPFGTSRRRTPPRPSARIRSKRPNRASNVDCGTGQ